MSPDISAGRRLYWSVRRELWENRSVYVAPPAVAGIVLIGYAVSLVTLPGRMRAAAALAPLAQREAVQQPFVVAAVILMAVEILVAMLYCLDALYGERRDRSILFWKSLPVSDRMTVLSKASIPILVIPIVTCVSTVVMQAAMLLAGSVVLAASGMSASILWTAVPIGEFSRINLIHLLMFHGIWYAPLYAWLLLASAWATRLPLLWAVLPPLAIGILERLAFDSTQFATLVRDYFLGGPLTMGGTSGMTMEMLAPQSFGTLALAPELWAGLALTALFLAAAVRLRRVRGAL